MGFWITILGAVIIGVAFSFAGGSRNCGRSSVGGSNTPPRRKSNFRENVFDDEIEDFDRFFGDNL